MKGQETLVVLGRPLPAGLVWLLAGLPLALVLHWFACGVLGLGTRLLFHEGGHALAGWACGCPSIPSAAGFTRIYEQRLPLALAAWGGLGWLAWSRRERPRLAAALGSLVLLYPLLAFTSLRMLLFDLGGHLGELLFGSAFAWIALRGAIQAEAERPFYGMFAWYSWFMHLLLCWRLLTDGLQREAYLSISITGGDNDLVKVADRLGWSLQSVALVLLLLGLAVPPALGAVWWRWFRDEAGRARLRRLLGEVSESPPEPPPPGPHRVVGPR